MSFANQVNKLIQEAPSLSERNQVNYGPLEIVPLVVRWETDKSGKRNPIKTPLEEYMEENGYAPTDQVELQDGETFQLRIVIGVDEVNPSLTFKYEREVQVINSNAKAKADWDTTVLPSIIKVFGKDWGKVLLGENGKKPKTVYVAAENVDSLKPVAEGKKNYGVPKFIERYATLEEAKAAHEKRYGKRVSDEEAMAFGDDEAEGEFTEEQLEQARSLWSSTKENRARTIKMLSKQYDGLDADALLDAALDNTEEEDDED